MNTPSFDDTQSSGQDNEDNVLIEESTGEDVNTSQHRKEYPQRERTRPKYLDDYITDIEQEENSNYVHTCTLLDSVDCCYKVCGLPQDYNEALNSREAPDWEQAMTDELNSLKQNDAFDLVKLPEGKNVVGGRWVYAIKENAEGSTSFKARYVAKGYSQKKGIDYQETFSPTADITSVRAFMQVAVQNNLIVHQMDVKTAYLHAPIDSEIYLQQPEGFEVKSDSGEKLVYKLKKSIYGLKQSGRNWNKLLHDHLSNNDFVQNSADYCVYKKTTPNGVIIVVIWVDDMIIAASNMTLLDKFKETMREQFNMKDLGQISYFLGINFTQTSDEIKMSQKRYITKMLEKFGMTDCKPRSSPCESKPDDNPQNDEPTDPRKFREVVGSLIYAATSTRPDISWSVSRLSQHLSDPKKKHMIMAKQVLRYLKGTIDNELVYKKSDKPLELFAFSDSDWASCVEDRKSTTGYCFSLTEDGAVFSWKSKKQPTVALSTCEAEYMALGATTQESLYLSQLLKDMDPKNTYKCVKIYEDNQGAIALCKNPVNRQRSKHIDIKYHFVRSVLEEGRIKVVYCPTENMAADILTKPASKLKIQKFKRYLFGN